MRVLPPRQAAYGELTSPLPPDLEARLKAWGIERLFAHQALAINHAREGKHVVLCTGTASGKTLAYLVPTLEMVSRRPSARALLVYPTKALAQDQLRKLRALCQNAGPVANVYDGDTPTSLRAGIRRRSHVVLTNPDMLHVSILPNHTLWADFLANLELVAVDEMHTYRGAFGAHGANVFRRLRRLCDHYRSLRGQRPGEKPVFVCCSATVGNPDEVAETLLGLPCHVVSQDVSPQGRKFFVLWQAGEMGARWDVARLLAFLTRHQVRSVAFAPSRKAAELLLNQTREVLRGDRRLRERVASYRAGYLPEERRALEKALFDGRLLAVIATTALEVGVDIGGLTASIMVGYPGSVASTWQQAGRSGRAAEDSLAVLVCLFNPLEQYLLAHPDFLLSSQAEKVVLNPGNPFVLAAQLMCAANERPLEQQDLNYFSGDLPGVVQALEAEGYLKQLQRYHWVGPEHPAGEISVRSTLGRPYTIVGEDGQEIGNVDADRAFYHLHVGAIYLHQGEQYLITRMDLPERRATAAATQVDYYTQPIAISEIRLGKEWESKEQAAAPCKWGEVNVTEQVVGFTRIQQFRQEVLGREPVALPPNRFDTFGLWLTFPRQAFTQAAVTDVLGAIHATEHCLIGVAPAFAACDPMDLGGVSHLAHPDTGEPTLAIYDGCPGGMGFSQRIYEELNPCLTATLEVILSCPCQDGCPRCVQSPGCGDQNEPLDKQGAARLLHWLLEPKIG